MGRNKKDFVFDLILSFFSPRTHKLVSLPYNINNWYFILMMLKSKINELREILLSSMSIR